MALPVAPASLLNRQELRSTVKTATFNTIPLILGETIVDGEIFCIGKTAPTKWVFGVLWGHGQQSYVRNVRLNDEEPKDKTVITSYVGTDDQAVDPTLRLAIVNYGDTMANYAYSVIQFDQTDYASLPKFTAECGGLPNTSNPAQAWATVASEARFLGLEIDEKSVTEVANHCNESVGGEVRRQLGIVIRQRYSIDQILDLLASYAGAWSNQREGKHTLRLNWLEDVSRTLTKDDIVRGGLVRENVPLSDVPNRVDITYTDIHEGKAQSQSAVYQTPAVEQGTEHVRGSSISMPGITRYSQALREARTRLNLLANDRYTLKGGDDLLTIERGDRIQYENLDLRVSGVPTRNENGIVEIGCITYRGSDYSAEVSQRPNFAGGKLIYE